MEDNKFTEQLSGHDTTITEDKMAHCKAVAEHMKKVAKIQGKDDLTADIYYVVGLLHDIGYLRGRKEHELNGAVILKAMGMKDEYAQAILNHGTNPYTLKTNEQTDILIALQDADMSVDKYGRDAGFKKRLEDIKLRYGADSEAYDTATKTVQFLKEKYNDEQSKSMKRYSNYERI